MPAATMQTLDGVVIGDAPLIRVRGLVNRFGDQLVHDGVDLDVRRGEILGVVGGSGTGKSVLMRSILALRSPEAGEIRLLGGDGRSRDPVQRRHIERNTGVLFQDGALFSSLTVGENVQARGAGEGARRKGREAAPGPRRAAARVGRHAGRRRAGRGRQRRSCGHQPRRLR